jgi:hypothetical protein
MLAVIKYKEEDLRVVFILGRDGGKVYCLASEKIPEPIVPVLSKILSQTKDLGNRVAALKKDFEPIYKSAFRAFDESQFQVIQTYDQRVSAS